MLKQELVGYQLNDRDIKGGILGDEMGLGKTIQALALIVNGTASRTLIVMPLAVRKQWEDAALSCNLNVYTAEKHGWQLHGKDRLRKTVFIAHYDKVVSNLRMFQGMDFGRIILDEAHRIRNTKSLTGANILKIKAPFKWVLTATPIVNTMNDAVAYLKFMGFPIESGGWNDKYEVWIRNIYLARTLDQCEAPAGLTMPPPCVSEVRNLEFTCENEKAVYNGIYRNLEAQWREADALNGKFYTLAILSILLRLRQVSINPQIYIKAREKEEFGWTGPQFTTASRKFEEIRELLQESHGNGEGHRWIIFCQFHEEMEMLKMYLETFDFVGSILQYHGGMSLKERQQQIELSKIVSPNLKQDVFLIQLQAGGTGLNLQNYDRIVFSSPWWTSACLDQAIGRAVRIGQKHVVKIYWLKLKDEESFNIDSMIMNKADSKRKLGKIFLSWAHGRDSMSFDTKEEI
jgi:SNF2 family DNA or RNA helicase